MAVFKGPSLTARRAGLFRSGGSAAASARTDRFSRDIVRTGQSPDRESTHPCVPADPRDQLHSQLHHCPQLLEKHSEGTNDGVGSIETAINQPASRETARSGPTQTAPCRPTHRTKAGLSTRADEPTPTQFDEHSSPLRPDIRRILKAHPDEVTLTYLASPPKPRGQSYPAASASRRGHALRPCDL